MDLNEIHRRFANSIFYGSGEPPESAAQVRSCCVHSGIIFTYDHGHGVEFGLDAPGDHALYKIEFCPWCGTPITLDEASRAE